MRSVSNESLPDDVTAVYRRGLWIRAVVAFAFLTLFLAFSIVRPNTQISGLWGLCAVLIGLIVVNPILWWIGLARGFPTRDFYIHWTMDIVAVTLIVHYVGGIDVPVTAAAYMVMIVSSATFSTWRTSWILAGVASVSYAAVLYAEHVGMIGHYHVGPGAHAAVAAQVISASGAILFFFVFAYLAGTLATQLRRKSEAIAIQKIEIEDSLRKEQASREGLVTLSTIVQHDVYGPLGIVSGACKEALRGCEAGNLRDTKRWLSQIAHRLGSIESAVASLGVFGTESDEKGNVEVYEIVDQVIGDLRSEWELKGVTVEPRGVWPIVAVSRAALYHVLRNVVANAIKNVPEMDKGNVVVSGQSLDGCGAMWRIGISDNGPGLPEDVQLQLRSVPQERVRLIRRASGNFGAGLSLAQVLASQWGGGITYEDTPLGATINVWIPIGKVRDAIL